MPATVTCAATSQSVTVAAGESKVASFSCPATVGPSTAKISGIMFLDENDKNNIYDGLTLEDNLKAANVLITLEGPTVGVSNTTQTDANGAYSFTDLAAGSYNVTIASTDPDIPATVVYGGVSANVGPITLAAGASATTNFPFYILSQTLLAYAFTGNDADTLPAVAPVKGVILDLYPTQGDAISLMNRIASDTTDAGGEVQFQFLRTADASPAGGTTQDQIVFAQIGSAAGAVPALTAVNGEMRIEIHYNSRTFTDMAPDSFDLLSSQVILKTDAFGVSGKALDVWDAQLFRNDTTAVAEQTGILSDATGRVSFVASAAVPLVDTFYVKLHPTQAAAAGHTFTQTPEPEWATVRGSYLRYVFTGNNLPLDTFDVGDHKVKFTTVDVFARVFHEQDDTLKMTGGDDFDGVGAMMVGLTWRQSGAVTDSFRAEVAPAGGTGDVTFVNVPTGQAPYMLWSRSTVPATQFSLEEDTIFNVGAAGGPGDMSGGTFDARICPLGSTSGVTNVLCGSFALKFENTSISGTVLAADATPANGMKVRVRAASRTLQPRPTDTTVTVAGGAYAVAGLREGDYIASILHDSVTADGDSVWASFTAVSSATVDLQESGGAGVQNFVVARMDTEISGVVVNDRDADLNTVDPGEGLALVTLQLYRDGSGAITLDTLVATTTTDANGTYKFTKLREGTHAVKVAQVAGSVTLRKFGARGVVVDTAIVHTMAAPPALPTTNADNLSRVGNTAPNPLPRWDYAASAQLNGSPSHFTFLYSTGKVTGRVATAVGDTSIVAMTMTLSRCLVSPSQPSLPAGVALPGCTSYFPGFTPQNVNTDAGGVFTFSNLQEGVYEVKSNPATAGRVSTTPTTGAMAAGNPILFTLLGNNDVETGNFTTP